MGTERLTDGYLLPLVSQIELLNAPQLTVVFLETRTSAEAAAPDPKQQAVVPSGNSYSKLQRLRPDFRLEADSSRF